MIRQHKHDPLTNSQEFGRGRRLMLGKLLPEIDGHIGRNL
jgi:hypothetical protein